MDIWNTTPRTIPEEDCLLGEEDEEHLPLWDLVGIFAFCFGYGLSLSTYALITFPVEAVKFFPDDHDFGLAVFLVFAGIAQLCGPAIGFLSDRCTSSYGKRRPYIAVSGLVLLPCLLLQWYCSTIPVTRWSIVMYYFTSFIGMICLCAMQTVTQGFAPDLVPRHQTGRANGVLVSLLGAGAAVGFGIVIALPSVSLYGVYLVVLTTSTLATLYFGGGDAPCEATNGWTINDILNCYWVSHSKYPDYFWLFVSRCFYYSGVSAQSFLQYYFRDWVVYPNGMHISPTNAKAYTALAAFMAQFGLAVTAIPTGSLSDKIGRKRILHVAAVGVSLCYYSNVIFKDIMVILGLSFLYGMMNGAILSTSYSLAVDCIPSKSEGAQWLAVWDVAAFIGSTIGPILCAPALFFLPPRRVMDGYVANSDSGYIAVMIMGGTLVLTSSWFLMKIKGKKVKDKFAL
eukprot:TRINITY_DN9175_c3_g1_i1.p1 TRINITY_DN9175_c3_g1~~TRINITY_DN9175_c3_g1_i1.p1  ORF type:complete len:465 (+),score=86.72 TRINITY_DN9175_c3_g1_i1:31-1395(+)